MARVASETDACSASVHGTAEAPTYGRAAARGLGEMSTNSGKGRGGNMSELSIPDLAAHVVQSKARINEIIEALRRQRRSEVQLALAVLDTQSGMRAQFDELVAALRRIEAYEGELPIGVMKRIARAALAKVAQSCDTYGCHYKANGAGGSS